MSKGRVKIFASHHDKFITLDNTLIENIRVAHQYAPSDSVMRGNDEGENIADKSESFCELVTQYWVWKNIKNLDYYGFCHYRRFISFGEFREPDVYANVYFGKFDKSIVEMMGYDRDDLEDEIKKYDIILTEPWDVSKVNINSVFEQYDTASELFIEDLECTLEIIKEKYPEYSETASEYWGGVLFYPCNMFIMKRDIFNDYCEWLFDILFELEKRRDTSNYSAEQHRMIGHIGERLLGVFVEYQKKKNNYKIGIKQRFCIDDMRDHSELILPFKMENNIPIIFATDDNFSLYTASTIHSIVKTSSENNNYDIFILYSNISDANKRAILDVIRGHLNFSIRFINVSKHLREYTLRPNFHISVETFYRLLAPELFQEYSKVIYLDSDLIVLNDLVDLFSIDIGTNLMAGVIDSDFLGQYNGFNLETKKYVDNELKLNDPYSYCQAGVLLFNFDEMRRTFKPYELVEVGNKKLYMYGDQDILNLKCAGRIHYIDMAWNVMHACGGIRLEIIKKFTPKEVSKNYFESRKTPKIIHYAGHKKPWNDPFDDFSEIFWSTIRDSPMYEKLIYKMVNKQNKENTPVESTNKIMNMRIVKRIYNKLKAVVYKIG